MPPPSDGARRRLLCHLALGAAACSPGWPSAAPSPKDTIRLGQSVPLSGPAQHLGIEYQRGLQLAFNAANADGGLGGRQIELISYDDGYEPEIALGNTRDLLEADAVFALVGYVGAEAVNRCLTLAVKAGVPFVAPLSGAESLRRNPSKWLFHLRPGLKEETRVIAQAMQTFGIGRVAVLVQDDADGAAGLEALTAALLSLNAAKPLAVARVGRNSTGQVELKARDTQAAAQSLSAVQPQALVCLAAYASTAAVLKAMRDSGFAGPCYATSLSSAAAIAPLLGPRTAGLYVTQVVPSPYDLSRPTVAAFQQRLRASGTAAPEYVSLEGWIVGSTVVEALRRMPRSGGREAFMAALESLSGTDLGGFSLRWDPQRRQVSGQVSLTVLDASGRPRR
jgi:ABC-type branched-subunit amino acid transport system substrate-binding protein